MRSFDITMTSAMASASTSSKSEFLVNGKYRLIRKIGSGSFGDIYLGINVSNGEVNWCYSVLTALFLAVNILNSSLISDREFVYAFTQKTIVRFVTG